MTDTKQQDLGLGGEPPRELTEEERRKLPISDARALPPEVPKQDSKRGTGTRAASAGAGKAEPATSPGEGAGASPEPKREPEKAKGPEQTQAGGSAPAGGSDANLPAKRIEGLRAYLEKITPAMRSVLPRHMTPERMVKLAIIAHQRTPELFKCTSQSVALSLMHSAELGLEPNGPLNHGWLIPYRNRTTQKLEAQFIVGYQGYAELARRTGEVEVIPARVVHANDKFEVVYGTQGFIKHTPSPGKRGEMIAAYAMVRMKSSGEVIFDVMFKDEIDEIRKRSKASNSGPWTTDYEEMAKKTVFRRLRKWIPQSVELAKAAEAEERAERGETPIEAFDFDVPIPAEVVEGGEDGSKADKLAASL